MADERAEGLLGWTWLGCGTVLFILVPLWVGLAAAFVHLLDSSDPTIRATWPLWRQGFFWSALLLLVIGLLVIGLWAVISGTHRVFDVIAGRRMAERYQQVVGDGDVLRADSWALTDGPQPDPTDDEVTEELP